MNGYIVLTEGVRKLATLRQEIGDEILNELHELMVNVILDGNEIYNYLVQTDRIDILKRKEAYRIWMDTGNNDSKYNWYQAELSLKQKFSPLLNL